MQFSLYFLAKIQLETAVFAEKSLLTTEISYAILRITAYDCIKERLCRIRNHAVNEPLRCTMSPERRACRRARFRVY